MRHAVSRATLLKALEVSRAQLTQAIIEAAPTVAAHKLGVEELRDHLLLGDLEKPKPRKRRAGKARKPRPLTSREAEVIQIVGECKGNLAQAARCLNRDRRTIEETYRTGMTKLGKAVYHSKDKTRLLARDRRGQETVSEDDDQRF